MLSTERATLTAPPPPPPPVPPLTHPGQPVCLPAPPHAGRLQNNPLFLESFLERHSEDDVLRFSYIVHCALDAIEERGEPARCTVAVSARTLPVDAETHNCWDSRGPDACA